MDLQSSADKCQQLDATCRDLSTTLLDERLAGEKALDEARRSLSEAQLAEEAHSARHGDNLGRIMLLQNELEVCYDMGCDNDVGDDGTKTHQSSILFMTIFIDQSKAAQLQASQSELADLQIRMHQLQV